ncbi:glycosyltransferase [Martelella alba]|uniref:glycosyltransferase n=1 Tax=Martelella alba TaxID=2590451 RepID=UPI001485B416|nr:glycosyltransferase [Martelella alba]
MHNYYPFCPQVNLWRDEKVNCIDYKNGHNCLNCIHEIPNPNGVKKALFLGDLLRTFNIKTDTHLFNTLWSIAIKFNALIYKFKKKSKNFNEKLDTLEKIEYFSQRRSFFVDSINDYVDTVLPVSKRVEDICINYGIKKKLCHTVYIGTEHSTKFNENKDKPFLAFDGIMTICYMGYMRNDKGFEFFLKGLSSIDENISKNIRIVIAAKKNDYFFDRLIKTSRRYHSLCYYNGYTHSNLDEILSEVDLGIIPPLWEDNLPQVAIEIHSRHIPILSSSAGGASEIHRRNPDFTFKVGSIIDFKNKLTSIYNKKCDMQYFANAMTPISMHAHIEELMTIYTNIISDKKTISSLEKKDRFKNSQTSETVISKAS